MGVQHRGRVCIYTLAPGRPCRRAHQWLLCPHVSPHDSSFLSRVWYWGYISFYDSSGYVQELGASLEESRAQLQFLQQHTWIDNM